MCGIVGYVGRKVAEPILVEGLRRLEYRGYDSSGLATLTGSRLHLRKQAGRIHDLVRRLRDQPAPGCVGISHTRWATHGPANDRNAHPHLGGDGLVAVVHNGVIENYTVLKRQMEPEGVAFHSDTDTEVVAQLIALHLQQRESEAGDALSVSDFIDAVSKALALLKGTYGLAVLSPLFPDVVIGARLGSPLVLGIGVKENFLASDPGALVGNADRVVYLQDHQLCVLTPDDWHILDQEKERVEASIQEIEWESADADKGVFDHYMLKEIYEQPEALENALRGRLSDADASAHFGGLNIDVQQLRRADRIVMTACGTSYHAALVGEYLFEEFAHPRRGGVRQRVPLPQPSAGPQHHRHGADAVGRDGRHPGRPARVEAQGTPDPGPVQRRRQQHRARGRRRRLPARRARDRRRQHQGVYQPSRRPGHARPLPRPDAPPFQHPRRPDGARPAPCRTPCAAPYRVMTR